MSRGGTWNRAARRSGGARPARILLPNVQGFYADAGAKLDGGELLCRRCGRKLPMRAGDGASYLRSGWPKCHGETMELLTQRQLELGAGAGVRK